MSSDLSSMLAWAEHHMATHVNDAGRVGPDFVVSTPDGPQLERWYVVPRNDVRNVYLHRFLLSDEDCAMHDHRGDNTSWLLSGEYVEHRGFYRNNGSVYVPRPEVRRAGDVVHRRAEDLHRIELVSGPVVSLFFIGPTRREWGFACPQGWRPWHVYVSLIEGGNARGRGCE